jgi:hypothetical protein
MAPTTKIIDMETVCNNVHNITDCFLEEMNKFLDQQRQIPPSNPIQSEKITPTLNRFDTKISPNFAPIDASKGFSDGTSSVTKHDTNSTNEITTEGTMHDNSKFVSQGNNFYHIVDNGYALVTNFGATTAANNSNSPLLPATAAPSLPATRCCEDAASRAAAGHLYSGLDTKLMENDARHNRKHHVPRSTLTSTKSPTSG